MDFLNVVAKRRMVRNFTDVLVNEEVLERILDVARRNPSAGFTQGQDFVVVEDPKTRREIARLVDEDAYVSKGFHRFVSGAPVLIIPCTSENAYHRRYQESDKIGPDEQEMEWPVPYWYMDVGCAVMLLLLAAVNEGLAAGFVGSHRFGDIKTLLGIPDEVSPVGVIPIGYPASDTPSPSLKRGRRSRKSVVHRERW